MKLVKEDLPITHLDHSQYRVSEDGTVAMAIAPVLFGFRIVVWDPNDYLVYWCSLCAGARPTVISYLYTLVLKFIESGIEPPQIKQTLRLLQHLEWYHSRPLGSDPEFKRIVEQTLTGKLTIEELHEMLKEKKHAHSE